MKSWSRRALEIAGESYHDADADSDTDEEMPELVYDEWTEDFDKLDKHAYKIVLERCAYRFVLYYGPPSPVLDR